MYVGTIIAYIVIIAVITGLTVTVILLAGYKRRNRIISNNENTKLNNQIQQLKTSNTRLMTDLGQCRTTLLSCQDTMANIIEPPLEVPNETVIDIANDQYEDSLETYYQESEIIPTRDVSNLRLSRNNTTTRTDIGAGISPTSANKSNIIVPRGNFSIPSDNNNTRSPRTDIGSGVVPTSTTTNNIRVPNDNRIIIRA